MILSHVHDSHWSALASTMALSPLSLMLDGYLQLSYLHRGRWHLLMFPQESLKTSGTSLPGFMNTFCRGWDPKRAPICDCSVWRTVICLVRPHVSPASLPSTQKAGPILTTSSPQHNTAQSHTEAFARSAERPAVTPRPAQAARAHRRDTFAGSQQCFYVN